MKRLFISMILLVAISAPARAAEFPIGSWARGDGDAKVRIENCGKAICAINTWIRDPKSEEKTGDRLVMTVAGNGGTLSGTAFDPQRNRSYKISINFNPKSMTTRGCILGGLLCKSVAWTRID